MGKLLNILVIVTERITINDDIDVDDFISRLKESARLGNYPSITDKEFVESSFDANEYMDVYKDELTGEAYIQLYNDNGDILYDSAN